jgi:hypothetical protein
MEIFSTGHDSCPDALPGGGMRLLQTTDGTNSDGAGKDEKKCDASGHYGKYNRVAGWFNENPENPTGPIWLTDVKVFSNPG